MGALLNDYANGAHLIVTIALKIPTLG